LVLSREAQQDTEKPLKFRAEANSGLLQLEKNARRCFRDWKISVPNEESGTFSRKKYRIVGDLSRGTGENTAYAPKKIKRN
jgi:hypothetical protein